MRNGEPAIVLKDLKLGSGAPRRAPRLGSLAVCLDALLRRVVDVLDLRHAA